MANRKNIEPYSFDKLTADKQREIAKKGGIRSVQVRKFRAKLSECAELLMSSPLSEEENEQVNKLLGTEGEVYSNAMAAIIGLQTAARTGDTKAVKLLAELTNDYQQKVKMDAPPELVINVSRKKTADAINKVLKRNGKNDEGF